ncbi:MAG: hypothetical protein ACP5MD_01155 [Verrucomicrobiia bacterium]
MGTVSGWNPVYAPSLFAVTLGVFTMGPWRYPYVYGVDEYGNMNETGYSKAVGDGNFISLDSTFAIKRGENRVFKGTATVSGCEGQQLWLFVFGDRDPDRADRFALCSGSDSSWFVPPGDATVTIDTSTADMFVFGYGGHGGPIENRDCLSLKFGRRGSLALGWLL